jgi:hypothetical protein
MSPKGDQVNEPEQVTPLAAARVTGVRHPSLADVHSPALFAEMT